MTENELLEKAALICVTGHAGQTDKAGQAYFQHPMRVAMRCNTTNQKIVALLHDTIEDTDVTPEYLLEQGFSQTIVEAVLSVTKRDGESYEDFIQRAAENQIGRIVKLHDLEDNLDVFRLLEVDTKTAQRLTKYLNAYRFLQDFIPTENAPKEVPNDIPIPELKSVHIPTKKEYWRSRRAQANININNARRTPKGATNFNKDRLMVTMPKGKVIAENDAINTFISVLRYFGFAKVEEAGLQYFGKYPLVAHENIAGKYKEATLGWYVLSKCPNAQKALYINQLADLFDEEVLAELSPK